MSVRFSGVTSQGYSATNGLPGSTYTVTVWAQLVVDRNATSGLWCYGTATDGHNTRTQADGTTLEHNSSGQTFTTVSMTVGTWYRVAWVANGTTGTLYTGAAGGAMVSASGTIPLITPTSFSIGNFLTGSSPLNGRLANFKQWNGVALTEAQIEEELAAYQPSITANLTRWHPFVVAETTDYSGNGNTLTAATGATTEDGPPIPWGPAPAGVISQTSIPPTVDAGRDTFGTVGFAISIQAVETGPGITARAWTIVSGPADVATTIGTASLLSWAPTAAGSYVLEYDVTNPAGSAYDTVAVTVTSTGTVVNSASITGTGATLVCNLPTSTAQGDVMLAVQSGSTGDLDEIRPAAGWQPLFAYDVGVGSLHVKGWTLTAGASEPSTYTFAQASGSAGTLSITAMRGVVEAGARWDLTYDSSTVATRTSPTVEVATPGSVLLCGASTIPGAARTWTPPTGMTEQVDVQSGTATTQAVASLLDPGAPTGTKSFTLSGATAAPGGVQWSVAFQMPYDPLRGVENRSMFSVVRTR